MLLRMNVADYEDWQRKFISKIFSNEFCCIQYYPVLTLGRLCGSNENKCYVEIGICLEDPQTLTSLFALKR